MKAVRITDYFKYSHESDTNWYSKRFLTDHKLQLKVIISLTILLVKGIVQLLRIAVKGRKFRNADVSVGSS